MMQVDPADQRALKGPQPAAPATTWKGRHAAVLGNEQVHCCVLQRGGVIGHFSFVDWAGTAQANALWEAPWWTADASPRSDEELLRRYGDLGAARFLENFTGHALCLDSFGPASNAAVSAGSGLHGEASIVPWTLQLEDSSHLTAMAHLPFARLNVARDFQLVGNETVLRVRESVTLLEPTQRRVHWVQHATVGAPMFGCSSRVSTSAKVGLTSPESYGGGNLVAQGREFVWPEAPTREGGAADLSELFARAGTGVLVALRQPAEAEYGFVAVTDCAQGTTLFYVFACASFPWLTLWEENRSRGEFPWNGEVQARGLEFGTTPWPSGNDANDAAGPVLDTPTARIVEAGETAVAPWVVALVATPGHWGALDSVIVAEDELVLCNGSDRLSVRAHGVRAFLDDRQTNG